MAWITARFCRWQRVGCDPKVRKIHRGVAHVKGVGVLLAIATCEAIVREAALGYHAFFHPAARKPGRWP
jgi:hypothetical protein